MTILDKDRERLHDAIKQIQNNGAEFLEVVNEVRLSWKATLAEELEDFNKININVSYRS